MVRLVWPLLLAVLSGSTVVNLFTTKSTKFEVKNSRNLCGLRGAQNNTKVTY